MENKENCIAEGIMDQSFGNRRHSETPKKADTSFVDGISSSSTISKPDLVQKKIEHLENDRINLTLQLHKRGKRPSNVHITCRSNPNRINHLNQMRMIVNVKSNLNEWKTT